MRLRKPQSVVASLIGSVLSAMLASAEAGTTVTVSAPSPATGTVQIVGSAKGGPVRLVNVSIDGVTVKSCYARECTAIWNTAGTSNGQHSVRAQALLHGGQVVSSARVVVVANADLVPSSPTLGTATMYTGTTTSLRLSVSNRGTATARSVAATISLAAAGGIKVPVATLNVGTLGAGASGTVETPLTAPTAPGNYTVVATVTTPDPEANTANNTTTATLGVSSSTTSNTSSNPIADIVASSLILGSTTLAADSTTPLTVTVSNRGTAAAQSVAMTISLAAGGITSRVTSTYVGALSAGGSAAVATSLTAPTVSGTYALIATATTQDPEASTENNTTSTTLVVTNSSTMTDISKTTISSTSCHYYASPNGGGNGLAASSPFQVNSFWPVAGPGKTLCLVDGIYQGDTSMIDPGRDVPGLSGTKDSPITVRALNDGRATIDGQFAHRPVYLNANDWWVLEGFNAKNGDSAAVVYMVNGSDNNVIRRVVAWDARIDSNNAVFGVHRSANNLLEDIAAFGTARKIISGSQGGDSLICRRCWSRWEGSIYGSPLGSTMTYNQNGVRFEDSLFTWSGQSMPQTYTSVADGSYMTDFEPRAPGAILSVDRNDGISPHHAEMIVRGSIVYTKATDRLPTTTVGGSPNGINARFWIFGLSSVTVEDVVSVMSPNHSRFNRHWGIALSRRPQNCSVKGESCEDPVINNTARRITSIRGTQGDTFHSDWTVSGVSAGTSLVAVQSPWQNTATNGARVCFRSDTSTPLWPWPMNERIKAATASAGAYSGPCPTCVGGRAARTETDVTADIETLLGTIPASCRQ